MSIWKKRTFRLRFFIETAVFCLAIFLVIFVCIYPREKSFSDLKDEIVGNDQFLFSGTSKTSNNFYLSINEGAFLEKSGPPFLVSGRTLAALDGMLERREIENYIVEEGDTVALIAEKFNISTETILWANNLSVNSKLKTGQELVILPVSGFLHIVKSGDTLSGISKIYNIESEKIMEANGLISKDDIFAGDMIIVPGAKKPKIVQQYAEVPVSGSYFIIPISLPARITQGLHWFNAIDFSNGKCGGPVFAAAGGTVQRVGYDNVSGNYVRIMHSNGIVTFYGHLSKISAIPGTQISQGQIIGYVGHTGVTYPKGEAGCHLHFDVRFGKNPFSGYAAGASLK